MPSSSRKQQKLFGMVYKCKKTNKCSRRIKKIADKISVKDAKDFASTKHDKLPEKVEGVISFGNWLRLREVNRHGCVCECPACEDGDCEQCSCEDCNCDGCLCHEDSVLDFVFK